MPPLYPPYVISFLISALLHGLTALISAHQYTSMHFIMFSPLLGPLPGSGMHLLHSEQCLIIPFMLPKLEILSCNVHDQSRLSMLYIAPGTTYPENKMEPVVLE